MRSARLKYTEEEAIEAGIHLAFATYRQDANQRFFKFDIPFSEFKKIIFTPCYYCKQPASKNSIWVAAKKKRNCMDRVDPRKGFVAGNVVSSCKTCQGLKGYATLERLGRMASIYLAVKRFTNPRKAARAKTNNRTARSR